MSIPTNTRRGGIRSTSADNHSNSTDGTDIVPPGGGGNKRFSRPNINLSMPRVRRSNNNVTTNNGENQQQGMIVQQQQQQGEEEFQNTRLQYFNERSSPSSNPNAKNYYTNNKHSNWILPTNYKLSSRIDIWFLLVISSCCAVASIGAIHSSAGKSSGSMGSGGFTSNEKFALSTSATSFILSFVMAIGLRYAPLRSSLTTNIYPLERHYDNSRSRSSKKRCLSTQGQIILSSFNITYELLVLSLLSIFWMASMGIICNDTSYYNGGNGMVSSCSKLCVCVVCCGGTFGGSPIF